MPFAILAPNGSRFAGRLTAQLTALAGDTPVRRFALEPQPEQPAAVDGEVLTLDGLRLDQASGVFLTGFRYEDPVLPPAGQEVDWSLWQCRHVLRQQGYSFLWSLLSRAEAAGVPMYNAPSVHLDLFAHQRPLDLLQAAGLTIPHVVMTNDPAVATRLLENSHLVVWRPIQGRAAWQIFKDKQRQAVVGADKPPVMLAPVLEGSVLRLYIVDGEVALAFGCAAPSKEGIERFEIIHAIDPQAVPGIAAATKAAATLGLRWGCLQAVSQPDGLVFYDVDPDPVVDDLPVPLAEHLAAALACGMMGKPLPTPPVATIERDTLLLRRMLTIQFDMEATKYSAG